MKSFKVQVNNDKAEFFKELLKSLDFVEFEEVEGFYEPRVYPGAKFEIRSNTAVSTSAPTLASEAKAPQNADDAMASIRKAMSQIDEQRQKRK
jgi:hypothetical protein